MRIPAAVFAVLSLACHGAAAADPAPDYAGTTLTGDWGGVRSAAWEKGWTWEAGLKVDSLRNRGGNRDGSQTVSHLDLKMRADLERLMGWDGAVAYVNVIDDRGAGINAHRTGAIMGETNIEVPVATTRLFHAWFQQSFNDDRFSVLAGLYPVDAEFFAMDSAALLLHPAYGAPADLALTRGPSIFNNSAFGLRAKWLSEDHTIYGMAALMDGIPNDPARPKATSIRFAKGDGAFLIAELGWTPIEEGHAVDSLFGPAKVLREPAIAAHEKYEGISKYAIGLWRYGNRVADQIDVDAAGDPLRRRSQGGYVLAERTLWGLGGPARDVTGFARYSFSGGADTSIDRMWNLGLRVRGPLASRPDDQLVFGVTRGGLSPKFRAAAAVATASAEEALEISWRFLVRPWLAIQPDVQYVRHPGGNEAAPTATLVGARLEIAF